MSHTGAPLLGLMTVTHSHVHVPLTAPCTRGVSTDCWCPQPGRTSSSDKQTPPQGQGHQSDSPPPWPSGRRRGCGLPSPEVGGEMEEARIPVQLFSSPRKGEASGEASAWDGGSRDMSPPGMSSPAPGEWILPGATSASSRVTPGLSNFPQDHVHLYLFHRWS